jgi:signal transduction histidine kinase
VFWERICPAGEEALDMVPGSYWRGSIPVQAYVALIEQVMETGNSAESFMSWREEDGSLTHYIFHIVAEYDSAGVVVGALAIGRDITALKEAEMRLAESRQHLRELAAHRDTAREEERKHIARELHDELGQFLSALRMQTSMLRIQFARDNPALAAHVNSMIEMIDSNIQVVRNISSALRPVVLDLGILAGLEWLVDEFVRYSGVPCTLDMVKEKFDMDNHFATTLFRVAQESLTNVARHADASKVRVSLQRTDSHYHLRIVDDGNGFVPEYVSKKTLGLIGMRERVLMLGGQIRIISAPGEGTTVKVDIPIGGV